MEDADGYKAKNGFPENETINAMCKTFCAAMEEAGNKTPSAPSKKAERG